jgi:hypothetical protein
LTPINCLRQYSYLVKEADRNRIEFFAFSLACRAPKVYSGTVDAAEQMATDEIPVASTPGSSNGGDES